MHYVRTYVFMYIPYVCMIYIHLSMYISMYCAVRISWRRDLDNRTQERTQMTISVCVNLKKDTSARQLTCTAHNMYISMYVCICTEYKPRGIEKS
jgi:hypothetical protein